MKLIEKRYVILIVINLVSTILAGIAIYYISDHLNKKNSNE